VVILVIVSAAGCLAPPGPNDTQWLEVTKIKFSLDDINIDGLRGPRDGLVAVSYEFCVPSNDRVYQEVLRIDPSVQFNYGSPGRIACADNQTLSIGETHQPHWRAVLQELSSLPYIVEIRECFFE